MTMIPAKQSWRIMRIALPAPSWLTLPYIPDRTKATASRMAIRIPSNFCAPFLRRNKGVSQSCYKQYLFLVVTVTILKWYYLLSRILLQFQAYILVVLCRLKSGSQIQPHKTCISSLTSSSTICIMRVLSHIMNHKLSHILFFFGWRIALAIKKPKFTCSKFHKHELWKENLSNHIVKAQSLKLKPYTQIQHTHTQITYKNCEH